MPSTSVAQLSPVMTLSLVMALPTLQQGQRDGGGRLPLAGGLRWRLRIRVVAVVVVVVVVMPAPELPHDRQMAACQ
jgi:hypothetical protein